MLPTRDPAFHSTATKTAKEREQQQQQQEEQALALHRQHQKQFQAQRNNNNNNNAAHTNDDDDDDLSSFDDNEAFIIETRLARAFAPDTPLPWQTFHGLRKSSEGAPTLTATLEANVMNKIAKLKETSSNGSGAGGAAAPVGTSIHESLPVVSAVVEKHCPGLAALPSAASGPREGATFALLAVITGHVELLKKCLELGSNPNDERFLMDQRPQRHYLRNGFTPFFVACICEQRECMQVLHEHGASLHTFDRWGRTPLHAAAALGNRAVVDWLLAHGAPRSIADRDSFRPGEEWRVRGGGNGGNSGGGDGGLASTLSAASSHFITIPARDTRFPQVLLRPPTEAVQPCPCGSGRVSGGCGCNDDMHERWYLDRVGTKWIPDEISTVMAESQSSVLALSFPSFVASSASQS